MDYDQFWQEKKSNKSKRTLNRIGIHHSVWLGRLLRSSSETIPVVVVARGHSPKTQPLQIQTRCSFYFSFSVSQQPNGGQFLSPASASMNNGTSFSTVKAFFHFHRFFLFWKKVGDHRIGRRKIGDSVCRGVEQQIRIRPRVRLCVVSVHFLLNQIM